MSASVSGFADEMTWNEWIIKYNFWLLCTSLLPFALMQLPLELLWIFNHITESYHVRAVRDFRGLCTFFFKILVGMQIFSLRVLVQGHSMVVSSWKPTVFSLFKHPMLCPFQNNFYSFCIGLTQYSSSFSSIDKH